MSPLSNENNNPGEAADAKGEAGMARWGWSTVLILDIVENRTAMSRNVTTLQYYNITILQHNNITSLKYYNITFLIL